MKKTATFTEAKKNPIVVLSEQNKVIYGDWLLTVSRCFTWLRFWLSKKKKGVCFKNELSNRRPFFELAGNTDSGKLLYNLCRMVKKTKLLWKIDFEIWKNFNEIS